MKSDYKQRVEQLFKPRPAIWPEDGDDDRAWAKGRLDVAKKLETAAACLESILYKDPLSLLFSEEEEKAEILSDELSKRKHMPSDELFAYSLRVRAASERRCVRECIGKAAPRTASRRRLVARFLEIWLDAGRPKHSLLYVDGEAVLTLKEGLVRKTGVEYANETVKGFIAEALRGQKA